MPLLNELIDFFNLQGLLLSAIIFIPFERLLALHKEQRVFREQWWSDLCYVLFNRLLITGAVGLIVIEGLALGRMLIPAPVRELVGAQPLWLQVIAGIVLADIGFYAAHRMFHMVPWLWRFHAVHHSIEELDWLAAARVHPIDQIITKGMSVLPLYALGFSTNTIIIYSAIYFWHSLLLHANVRLNFGPLRWLIASPEFHHWHHANEREAYDQNFAGQLAILDRLFGTMYMPEGRVPAKYGVDEPIPHNYLGQLIYPFQALLRRRKKKAAGAALAKPSDS